MQILKQKKLVQENRQIKEDIEELVQENSRIVEVILEELEYKINVIKDHEAKHGETVFNHQQREHYDFNKVLKDNITENAKVEEIKFNIEQETKEEDDSQDIGDIFSLKEQGYSLPEIAEKLNMSQGEVALNIRLQERLQAIALADTK